MPLNKSSGNMYPWITHTWNPIKGLCSHDCSYCYMKRWGKQKPIHLDEQEMKTYIPGLGSDHFIFVGSSCDMFANDIPVGWIKRVLNYIRQHPYGRYLFQSKNPERILDFLAPADTNFVLCTTLETNRFYKQFMGNSPTPKDRALAFEKWYPYIPLYITIEPIMDFDLEEFIPMIKELPVHQVNIGADSGRNHLPEPSKEKILELIAELERFTEVVKKKNLGRLVV